MDRFYIEQEEVLEDHCRCFSCYMKTGRWILMDRTDAIPDRIFPKKELAESFCREMNEASSQSLPVGEQEMDLAWDIIFDLINLGLIPSEIPIEDGKFDLAHRFILKRISEGGNYAKV